MGIAPVAAVTSIAVALARLFRHPYIGVIGVAALTASSLIYCWTLYYLTSISNYQIEASYAGFWLWVYLPMGLAVLLPSYFIAYQLFRRIWPTYPPQLN